MHGKLLRLEGVCSLPASQAVLDAARHDDEPQVDPNVIAYVACRKEVEKAWEEVTGGASITSGAFEPPLIAKLGAMLSSELRATSSPYVAAAKLQVRRLHATAWTHAMRNRMHHAHTHALSHTHTDTQTHAQIRTITVRRS